jgi:hypothetical protein
LIDLVDCPIMIELSVDRDHCQAILLFVQDSSRSKSYVVVVQQDRVLIGLVARLVPLSNRLLPSNRLAFVVVETI